MARGDEYYLEKKNVHLLSRIKEMDEIRLTYQVISCRRPIIFEASALANTKLT
jgi:hypothetical protein